MADTERAMRNSEAAGWVYQLLQVTDTFLAPEMGRQRLLVEPWSSREGERHDGKAQQDVSSARLLCECSLVVDVTPRRDKRG